MSPLALADITGQMPSVDWFTKMTQLFIDGGPFFLGLFLMVGLAPYMFRKWQKAAERQNPKASDNEIRTLQRAAVASFIFGIAVTGAALVWWFIPHVYVYRGKIVDLKSYEHVSSSDLFANVVPHDSGTSPVSYRDMNFVVVQEHRFKEGDKFEIRFSKEGSNDPNAERRLTIPWQAKPSSWHIEFDDSTGQSFLKQDARLERPRFSFDLVPSAEAQIPARVAQMPAVTPAAPMAQMNTRASDPAQAVFVLQNSQSSVTSKLRALDRLSALGPDSAKDALLWTSCTTPIASQSAPKCDSEPLAATLLDLTRYSDAEVAFKARRLTASWQVSDAIGDALKSSRPGTRKAAQTALFRLDRDAAQKVLATAGQSTPDYAFLSSAMKQSGPKMVIPTATSSGDQYYVHAEWNPADQKSTQCVAQLFRARLTPGQKVPYDRRFHTNHDAKTDKLCPAILVPL